MENNNFSDCKTTISKIPFKPNAHLAQREQKKSMEL